MAQAITALVGLFDEGLNANGFEDRVGGWCA